MDMPLRPSPSAAIVSMLYENKRCQLEREAEPEQPGFTFASCVAALRTRG